MSGFSKPPAPSGAEKRKKKREEHLKASKLIKIDALFSKPDDSATFSKSIPTHLPQNESETAVMATEVEPISTGTASTSRSHADIKDTDTIVAAKVAADAYPSDRGNFEEDMTDPNLKRFILSHGSCKPCGPFPRDKNQENRSFSENDYVQHTKTNVDLPRMWLCYSPKLDMCYCEPCWLFADRSGKHYQRGWSRGIRDWKGLSKKIKEHETCNSHHWKHGATIDSDLEVQIKKNISFWRQLLDRIISITLTLATNNLAFRGHRKKLGTVNSGNFLALVELLAKYDPVLQKLLEMPEHSVKYLSPRIQNEIIELLSSTGEKSLISDINNAPFFSIIADTTQDISKVDQLSLIYRYVTLAKDDNGLTSDINVREVFLGFFPVTDQSAAGIEGDILSHMESKGIDLSKCRGQGYDGAATMSGVYNGVQAKIMQKQPNAVYIHCAAHNLNLVLNDAVSKITEISTFFSILERVYVFFGHSIKRWEILTKMSESSKLTLKRLNPTRWSSRNQSLTALRYQYHTVMKALSTIILNSKKSDERSEALAIQKELEKFEFVFLVVLMEKVLQTADTVSKVLQSNQADLMTAARLLESATKELSLYRANYDGAHNSACTLAGEWGVNTKFMVTRIGKKKKFFDELCEDQRLEDPESAFRVTVFYECLDIVIAQLNHRFCSLRDVVNMFKCLFPTSLSSNTDDVLFREGSRLANQYSEDLSPEFPQQLLRFRCVLKNQIAQATTIKDIAIVLLVQHYTLSSNFPDVCTAYFLFLTLPVTVASAERSFSKLKIIKNYLRSTMSQERLRGLALLSIEAERARCVNMAKLLMTLLR